MALTHYFVPERLGKTVGNVAGCCKRPADEHPAFEAGTITVITLKRSVRALTGKTFAKGTRLVAERTTHEALVEVRPSRWGTNELGQFAEIDKGEYARVVVPGYAVDLDGYRTGIPVAWGVEA